MMTEAVLDTATGTATLWDTAAADATAWGTASEDSVVLDTMAWTLKQWGTVELGDARLTRRAVHLGTAMAAHPAQSLPQQWGDPAARKGAYSLLNHPGVTLGQLATPHWEDTRHAAAQEEVVLLVQDTTEVDYTHHPTKKGLGPIGNGQGRGLLLHSTVAVVPGETPQVLGLAHHQVVLRQPAPKPRPQDYSSPEGQVWAQAAEAVGPPPRPWRALLLSRQPQPLPPGLRPPAARFADSHPHKQGAQIILGPAHVAVDSQAVAPQQHRQAALHSAPMLPIAGLELGCLLARPGRLQPGMMRPQGDRAAPTPGAAPRAQRTRRTRGRRKVELPAPIGTLAPCAAVCPAGQVAVPCATSTVN